MTENTTDSAEASSPVQDTIGHRQYLSFILEGEEFALDILRVQEIRGWSRPTYIPNSPPYMCGVINLRGAIIPVIDLRVRFGLAVREYSVTTVVVVLRVMGSDHERVMGVVVDAMAETYNIPQSAMQPAAKVGGLMDPEFVTGLATVEDKMVVVLDVDELMNSNELADEGASDEDS